MPACRLILPAPATVPISSLADTFKSAELPTLTATLLSSALPPATVSVPAPTVTGPANVFEPEIVNSAIPCFRKSNAPLMLPPSVTALATDNCVLAASATGPANVSAPKLVASPRVSEPERTEAFASERAIVALLASLPPVKRSVPVPRAAASPTRIVPACRSTPPVKVLAAERVRFELPAFTSAPEPLTTPPTTEAADPLIVSVLPWRFTSPAPVRLSIRSEDASFRVAPPATLSGTLSAIAEPPANVRTPWLTLAAPVNTFAPDRINSAAPVLVKPLVPPTTPLRVALLTTLKDAPFPRVTAPESVRAPELIASPKASAPLSSTAFPKTRAVVESLETRPPLSASLPVPNAALVPACRAPAVCTIPPLKLLAPVSVSTEAPLFTNAPLPLIAPPKLVIVVPFKVRVLPCRFTAPTPEIAAISSELESFNTAPDPTATVIESESALPPASVKVPPITAVVPPNTFVPLKVSSLLPAFTKLNPPLKAPFKFTGLSTVTVALAVSVETPLKLNAPLFTKSPNETRPPKFTAFTNVRAVEESLVTTPPVILKAPVPSAALFPIRSVPVLSETPPENELLPERASTELPVFTSEPAPVTVPESTEASVPPIVSALPWSETTPAPFTLEICCAAAIFNVAEVPTVTGVVFNSAAPPASVSVPTSTEAAPVNALAPLKVSSERPVFTMPDGPLTTPEKVTGLPAAKVTVPARLAAPLNVSNPLFTASPRVTVPDNAIVLSERRAALESLEIRPPLTRTAPVPKALLLPSCSTPLLRFTPPEKLFNPESVSTELPLLIMPPAPATTPLIAEDPPPLSVNEPAAIFTIPEPVTLASSSEAFSLRVPAVARTTEFAFEIALPPAKVSTPPFTTVVPVNVLVPLRISSAAPSFTKP